MKGRRIGENKFEIKTTEIAKMICKNLRRRGWNPLRRNNIIYTYLSLDIFGWLDDEEDKKENYHNYTRPSRNFPEHLPHHGNYPPGTPPSIGD